MDQFTPDQEKPFKIDEQGNVVGPGFFVRAAEQPVPGHVLLSIDMLNLLYSAGHLAGKLTATTVKKAEKERVARVLDEVESLQLPPGVHTVKLLNVETTATEVIETYELSNGETMQHRSKLHAEEPKVPVDKRVP